MNIAEPVFVLTYDCPHRKTYDTLTLLNAKGFKNVTVFCHPMTYMKTFRPLLQHRPPIVHDIDTQTLCKNLGFRYISLQSVNGLSDYVNDIGETPVLIVGAGLIPDVLLNTIVFINAHPGYSPYARGLDAFKWSLLKNLPIGVTVHTVKGNEEEKRREEKRREEKPTTPTQVCISCALFCNRPKQILSIPWRTKCTNMRSHCLFSRSNYIKMLSKKIAS